MNYFFKFLKIEIYQFKNFSIFKWKPSAKVALGNIYLFRSISIEICTIWNLQIIYTFLV